MALPQAVLRKPAPNGGYGLWRALPAMAAVGTDTVAIAAPAASGSYRSVRLATVIRKLPQIQYIKCMV